MRRLIVGFCALCLLTTGLVPATADEGSKYREPIRSKKGVVATEAPAASEVGVEILDEGGNAVDAAVTMMIAMTAARPQSCGIGGGGFLVYRSAKGKVRTLDFRETAPAAMRPDTFQTPSPLPAFTGHLTVGVPGILRGAEQALRKFGTISMDEALKPAERLAAEGIEVLPSLSAAMAASAERLKLFPPAARIYLKNSTTPYAPGDILRNPDLAKTLELLRKRGIDEFYDGKIAELIDEDMRSAGQVPGDRGILRREDLERYKAKWRKPVTGKYNGHSIIGMPPPTSGGIATIQMLNLLEGFDIEGAGQSSADHLHFTAEAQKIAFADRAAYVADPDFEDVPTKELISKAYADERRDEIDPDVAKSYPPGVFGAPKPDNSGNPNGHTTHISVIDRDGNTVALDVHHRGGVRERSGGARDRFPPQQRNDRLRSARHGERARAVQASAFVDVSDDRRPERRAGAGHGSRRGSAHHHGCAQRDRGAGRLRSQHRTSARCGARRCTGGSHGSTFHARARRRTRRRGCRDRARRARPHHHSEQRN